MSSSLNFLTLQGQSAPFIIAGPCVIESEEMCLQIADSLARSAAATGVDAVFKASYDKANRTSRGAFRGPGLEGGLRILDRVRRETGLPIVTDVHQSDDAVAVGQVVDIVQIPAFLCRQTDLLLAAASTGKHVNVKKGQFMAPSDMAHVVDKVGPKCLLTERGTFFGYNRLVVDFTGIQTMKGLGVPVVFDATHSVQIPGGGEGCSGGNRDQALPLAMSAVCHGVDGLFFEIHPDPDNALCDGANSLALSDFEKALPRLKQLHDMISGWDQ